MSLLVDGRIGWSVAESDAINATDDASGYVGLRYVPTGAEALTPGCPCEGWGLADATSGLAGYADEAAGTSDNLALVSWKRPKRVPQAAG